MSMSLRYTLPVILPFAIPGAHGQYLKKHKATFSVGATDQFSTILRDNAQDISTTAPLPVAGTYAVVVSNQKQYTANSTDFLTSMQRSLIYRSPNFRQPAFSTHRWCATTQPVLSAFYRF